MPDKFTEYDLFEAVKDLATMRYFPADSKASVMRQLAAMCPSLEALRYTVDKALAATSDWPGLAELRGILCNKFEAADGVDGYCTIPGLSAADNEARYIAEHSRAKTLAAPQDINAINALRALGAPRGRKA